MHPPLTRWFKSTFRIPRAKQNCNGRTPPRESATEICEVFRRIIRCPKERLEVRILTTKATSSAVGGTGSRAVTARCICNSDAQAKQKRTRKVAIPKNDHLAGFPTSRGSGRWMRRTFIYGNGRTKFRGSFHNARAMAGQTDSRRFLDVIERGARRTIYPFSS